MPCFLCNHTIAPSEACGALEFAGDALAERGRYAVHRECLRPEWKKRFVTREQLLHPEALSLVNPQLDVEQYKWWHEAKELQYSHPSPVRRLLAQFFKWGSRQFAVEPLTPRMLGYNDDGSARRDLPPFPWQGLPKRQGPLQALSRFFSWGAGRGSDGQTAVPTQAIMKCANPGCMQSPGATGFCSQHQWRMAVVAEPATEPPLPAVYTLAAGEAAEAMHKHDRCCVYDEHFRCAEFIRLAQQYVDMGGVMSDLGLPWGTWNPYDPEDIQSTAFFVVENPSAPRNI